MKIQTLALLLCLITAPAFAQMNMGSADDNPPDVSPEALETEADEIPVSHSVVVTSLQKCLDQLDAGTAADVRANYIEPYKECQNRLILQKQKEQEKKIAAEKAADAAPAAAETPRNYVRVQKTVPKAESSDKSGEKPPQKQD